MTEAIVIKTARAHEQAGLALAVIRRPTVAIPILLAIVGILLVPHLSSGAQLKWILWLAFGVTALSLDFVWGKAGIFCFGQSALFGIGAYAYAVAAINIYPLTQETITALLIAGLTAALAAVILGYVIFYGKIGDVYLAIVTLAVTLALYTIMTSTAGPQYHIGAALLGGFNGMPGVPGISIVIPGLLAIDLDTTGLLYFTIGVALFLYLVLYLLTSAPFGRALSGIRDNEMRMELLGYNVTAYKLAAFVIGGAVAGVGGALFAAWGMFVNPSLFALSQAALIVIWVMVGGRGTLLGAFLGVVFVQWVSDEADRIVSEQTPLILGVMLIIVVLLFPRGLIGVLSSLGHWLRSRMNRKYWREHAENVSTVYLKQLINQPIGAPSTVREKEGPMLEAKDVTMRFGALEVLRGVNASIIGPGVHAIIGANGAGKSTFFNVLMGRFAATSGEIRLLDREISKLAIFQRARLGLGVKTQVPSLCEQQTVADNLCLVLQRRRYPRVNSFTRLALNAGGLVAEFDTIVSELPHGKKQWLEIAMVLAQEPELILLDEPAAGMTPSERDAMVSIIRELRTVYTLIVVEHDMNFIKALNAPVSVLHQGVVFRTGNFEAVCSDPEVIDAYLGRSNVTSS